MASISSMLTPNHDQTTMKQISMLLQLDEVYEGK
jgi:hypothetical protein